MSMFDAFDEPTRPNARERVQTALAEYQQQQLSRRGKSICPIAKSGDHVQVVHKDRGRCCAMCLLPLMEDGSERL